MMPTILHLEDSELDATLIVQRLKKGGFGGEIVRATGRWEYEDLLNSETAFDLILSDYQLPSFDGAEALEMAKRRRPGVPFVFVSGALGEEIAVDMLKRGATDYVLKQRMDRLASAVERAIAESRERAERLRVENALRESEGRLRLALTAVRMVAWELIPDPLTMLFVGNLQDVFGLPEGNRLETAEQRRAILHPADATEHLATVHRAIERGGNYVDRFRVIRPDNGAVQWIEERAHAICDDAGKVTRLVGVMVDITERKAAEDEVRRLNDQLEEKVVERTSELLSANEQLQGFTYSVAHDLRQQIRGISTNASSVLYDAPDALDEVHRHSLQRLVQSARQLSALVDDLLRYARLGRQQTRREKVDLSELALGFAAELLSGDYGHKTVSVDVEPDMIVYGDPSMLAIAVQNLVDNAFKYSSQAESPIITFRRHGDGFCVEDNGVGFDMAFAHKVFEPFERLHVGTVYRGTGIGLANVKRIIEKHEGKIWVDSIQNEGTRFYFTLGQGSTCEPIDVGVGA